MKRNYFIFPVYMFIILITTISSGYSGTLNRSDYQKLDPQLAALIEHPDMASLIFHQAVGKRTSFPSRLNVIIKTSLSRAELNQYRVIVHCKIGQITTASIFPDELPSLVQNPDIYFIKLPRKVSVLNDVSIPAIRVPEIWNQYGLKGRCVIIGIIDTGIDWRHEDFRNSDGTTRIKALLDFSDPGDTNGDEILDGTGPFGGSLYLEDQINQAISGGGEVSEKDLVGHGTHVAGSAAGNGRATGNGISSNTYVGVAPEADLIIVKAARDKGSRNFYDFDYINAIKFIDSMSTVLREPYVINLSLGGSNGPHDGRDLAEQAIDELVGRNKRGKAIVISAGNDGEKAIHSTGTFTNYNNSYEIRFSIPNYNPNSDNMDDYVFFEGWYSASDIYKIKIITPTNKIFGPVTTGNEYGTDTNEGAIYITNAKNGTSPLNGDRQFLVQVYDFTKQNTPASGEWKIIIEGTSGRYDLWLSASTMDAYLTSQTDNSMIVGTPGTAFNAITVGSYVTKVRWIDYDNNDLYIPNLELEYASAFSSPGPTRDGRIKPEISAPGEMIAASLSADAFPGSSYSMFETGSNQFPNGYVARDGKHGISKGTSFSAPHVTGTVALLFSYNPNLDAIDVRNAIINSAKKDGFTGSTPNDKWGYGKLDAYNAIKYIINNPPEITLNLAIFQNPALTQYIDFYLIHSLRKEAWERVYKLGVLNWAEKMREKGYIKYIGFSFHDEFPVFKNIIDSHNWDFCQIQYNYMDINFQAGQKGLKYAAVVAPVSKITIPTLSFALRDFINISAAFFAAPSLLGL